MVEVEEDEVAAGVEENQRLRPVEAGPAKDSEYRGNGEKHQNVGLVAN